MRRLLLVAGFVLLPVVAFAQQAETIEYYGTDAIGSIRIVWDASGNVIARQDFTPFGEPVLQQGTAIPKEGFGGNEADAETNQDYFHARMFEARTGRFTRTDPILDALMRPQAWNRYSISLNNSLVFPDPTGLDVVICGWMHAHSKDFGDYLTPIFCDTVSGSNKNPGGGNGDGTGGDGRGPHAPDQDPRNPHPRPSPTPTPAPPAPTPPAPPAPPHDPSAPKPPKPPSGTTAFIACDMFAYFTMGFFTETGLTAACAPSGPAFFACFAAAHEAAAPAYTIYGGVAATVCGVAAYGRK